MVSVLKKCCCSFYFDLDKDDEKFSVVTVIAHNKTNSSQEKPEIPTKINVTDTAKPKYIRHLRARESTKYVHKVHKQTAIRRSASTLSRFSSIFKDENQLGESIAAELFAIGNENSTIDSDQVHRIYESLAEIEDIQDIRLYDSDDESLPEEELQNVGATSYHQVVAKLEKVLAESYDKAVILNRKEKHSPLVNSISSGFVSMKSDPSGENIDSNEFRYQNKKNGQLPSDMLREHSKVSTEDSGFSCHDSASSTKKLSIDMSTKSDTTEEKTDSETKSIGSERTETTHEPHSSVDADISSSNSSFTQVSTSYE